ncbi:ATP-binding protein [Hymenobacter sp. RP-2-7]|uniref:ATP-binding protein n=1 Tax=Hymenobacter polaris TaxID=2682546 RepID=A0A7Y0AHN1_9BACT|nr:AAA family ATPase [Hymenobacter polaris]NML67548.1 ATP-binding protein [Hymenobacter polaris]
MELRSIRIRNFRSVEQEQYLLFSNGTTIVGPNSSGKTNILKAVKMLFTGFDNILKYNRVDDLTFGQEKNKTSITAQFDGNPDGIDKNLYSLLDELHKLQGTIRNGNLFSLSLYFTDTSTPVYNIFPNVKRPNDLGKAKIYSRVHRQLVTQLIESFSIYYVPAAKSIRQLYEDLLAPLLRKITADALSSHIPDVASKISDVSNRLNEQLELAGLSNLKASFIIPENSLESFFTNFDFVLEDPAKTPIYEKGMGIQSTALIASFLWITQEMKRQAKNVIWLLEEPESYLHPELSVSCLRILSELEKESLVIKTTHSLSFVPQDPDRIKGVTINSVGRTEVSSYRTYVEATSSLRRNLGVRFSDFYNLGQYNVMVEGPSDREIFNWFLSIAPVEKYSWPLLRQAQFLDYGGVKFLSGFLRATYQFVSKERSCVAVFDGDDAGTKEYKDLQGYFGQIKIPFQANNEFIVVRNRFPIEGLFPDDWIKDAAHEHQNWFKSFTVDASDELAPFDVHDNHKNQLQNALMQRVKEEQNFNWAKRFLDVCNAIDSALSHQDRKLHP